MLVFVLLAQSYAPLGFELRKYVRVARVAEESAGALDGTDVVRELGALRVVAAGSLFRILAAI